MADEDSAAPNKGYVTNLLGPDHFHGGDVDVYLCGPPAMVEAVDKHLDAEGLPINNFFTEKFALAAEGAS